MSVFDFTNKGRKYIIETKVNRANIHKTIDRAVEQLAGKYLLTEKADEGYVVVFDVKTRVRELCTPEKRMVGDKTGSTGTGVISFHNFSDYSQYFSA